jgi:enoyl-CoA hydratase
MTPLNNLETLHCDINGSVATVTLNRPDVLNALNALMFDELERVFIALTAEPTLRAVVLTGSRPGADARAFAAGADIRGLVDTDALSGLAVSRRGQYVFSLIESHLERSGKPVIAAINGVALGGGFELALACTLRIASDTARLGLPEVKLGLIPGYGGSQRLPRLIGPGPALRMMLTAQVVDAPAALRLGIVDEVVPAADLLPRALALAETIAAMAPLAIAGILEAVHRGVGQPLPEALEAEAGIFGRLCGTADKHEGLTAFLAKRPPTWQGR